MKKVFRGNIYICDLPYIDGSIQYGERPIIIVSNDMANMYSPVVHYVPLTTKSKSKLPVHHVLKNKDYACISVDNMALCEQTMLVSKNRIGKFVGTVSEEDMRKIDRCMKIQMELN